MWCMWEDLDRVSQLSQFSESKVTHLCSPQAAMKNESSQHRRHLPPKQAKTMLKRFPNLTSEIWRVNLWRRLSSEHIGRPSKDTYLLLIMLYFPYCLCSQYTLKWDVTVFWAESKIDNQGSPLSPELISALLQATFNLPNVTSTCSLQQLMS